MFVVVETGGKQYLVKKGSIIKAEKLESEEGKEVEICKVIYILHTNKGLSYEGLSYEGLSYLPNVTVKAEVLKQCKEKKILVFKKKRRKNYRRKTGHRQYITILRINEINFKVIR